MTIKKEAFNRYYKKFNEYPDLDNPKDFNEKIQWLKIYDQDPLQIKLCDKVAAKEWVAQIVGEKYVIPSTEKFPAVWKTNHDSGGIAFLNSEKDIPNALDILEKRLKRKHGMKKGEWAYRFIEPQIIKEKMLTSNVDYKFHCVDGKVKCMQMVWDRDQYGKECVFDEHGELTDFQVEPKNVYTPHDLLCPKESFFELKSIAEKLSTGFKYVRVDLYWSDSQPWFGEMTFWPSSGCIARHEGLIKLGNLLDFDRTTTKIPVVE